MSQPTSNDPEELRRQIEETRLALSTDVNALGEAVSPGNVARRQRDKVVDTVRGAGASLRERVMGSDDDPFDPVDSGPGAGDRLHAAQDRISDAAGSARDAVTGAPAAVQRRTRGNPLAAGLIALGAGWLLGSLIPASDREQQLARQAKDRVQDSGLGDEVKAVAQDAQDHLRPAVQQAVADVKDSAQAGVEHVRSDGQAAVSDVQDRSVQARDNLRS